MSRTGPDEQQRHDADKSVSRHVGAPPRAVFKVLANGWLYPAWVVGASRMREVDDHWPNQGAELHHSFGVWPLLINDTTTVKEWQPDRRMVLVARGWPTGEATVVITVEPAVGGCRVTIEEDVTAGPALAILPPVRWTMVRWRNTETLRRLAFLAEGSAGSTDGNV